MDRPPFLFGIPVIACSGAAPRKNLRYNPHNCCILSNSREAKMGIPDNIYGGTPVRTKQNWMLAVVALASSALASAGPIIYNVNLTIGSGSATGTITTDGNIGALSQSDVTAFSLTISDGTSSLGPYDATSGYVAFAGAADLLATPTTLSFNFSDPSTADAVLFRINNFPNSGTGEVCFTGAANCAGVENVELICIIGSNCNTGILPVATVSETGTQVIATASSSSVPEPSSLMLLSLGCAALLIPRNRPALARLRGGLSRRS
jgi:hypothetical protein